MNVMMRTDAAFCSNGGGQVRRIMERRRKHGECGAGSGGCEVVVGASCGGAKGRRRVGEFWKRRVRRVEVSLMMWVVGLLVMSFVVNLCFVVRLYYYWGFVHSVGF